MAAAAPVPKVEVTPERAPDGTYVARPAAVPAYHGTGAKRVQIGTSSDFDPFDKAKVEANRARLASLPTGAAAVQDSMARQRADIAQEQADRQARANGPATRSPGVIGTVVPMGTRSLATTAVTGEDASASQVDVAKMVGADCIRFVEDRVRKEQPHTRMTAQDFRVAYAECPICRQVTQVPQSLPHHENVWTPDLGVVLLGVPSQRHEVLLPKHIKLRPGENRTQVLETSKENEVVGFGGGGAGWFTDGSRVFCSKDHLQRAVIASRHPQAAQQVKDFSPEDPKKLEQLKASATSLPPVLRIGDVSYRERFYETSEPGEDVTTPAAPPRLSGPGPAAPAPAATAVAPAAPSAREHYEVTVPAAVPAPTPAVPAAAAAAAPRAPRAPRATGSRRSAKKTPKVETPPATPTGEPTPEQ